ncbi:MAG: phosphoribosyltransferase [Paludibacter sp.]|nr:phosphoribosyltransferase [Paludibacter sp.]
MKNLTKGAYKGIRQRNVNETVWNIYGYKFFKNEDCFKKLISFAENDLSGLEFDYVIPIKPRNSGSDITYRLAVHIAGFLHCDMIDLLLYGNRSATKRDLKSYNILIVDDVMFTGKTAQKAFITIKNLKPKTISFYSLAKSDMK